MKKENYYNILEEKNSNKISSYTNKINSDFNLIFQILKELLLFLIKLPFYLILTIFYFIILNFEKANLELMKILEEPFKIISKFLIWFFEAKFTAYLIILLIIIYILEFIVFIPFGIFNFLLFFPIDLFSFRFYSILSSIFIHANIVHLLGNLLALLIFGRIVERQFGFKMFWIFLFSAIIANIVSGFISYSLGDFRSSLGASGGIAGLIIFAILLEPFAISSVFILPLPIFILGWFLISLDISGLSNPSLTNNLAHLGGYLALLILFFFLEFKHKNKIIKGFIINFIMFILLYILLSYFGFSFNLKDIFTYFISLLSF